MTDLISVNLYYFRWSNNFVISYLKPRVQLRLKLVERQFGHINVAIVLRLIIYKTKAPLSRGTFNDLLFWEGVSLPTIISFYAFNRNN